jgi:hypothetical protein
MQGKLILVGKDWYAVMEDLLPTGDMSVINMPVTQNIVDFIEANGGQSSWEGQYIGYTCVNIGGTLHADLETQPDLPTPPPANCNGPKDWIDIYTDFQNSESYVHSPEAFRDWLVANYYQPYPL